MRQKELLTCLGTLFVSGTIYSAAAAQDAVPAPAPTPSGIPAPETTGAGDSGSEDSPDTPGDDTTGDTGDTGDTGSDFLPASDFDEDEGASNRLQAVHIDALRLPQSVSAVPNTVNVVDRDALDAQSAVSGDLSTVLGNLIPGFSPSRQKLTNDGETLRGRSPLYLLDGVPQSNPLRDGSRDGYTVDPDLLERVEVVNGSNAIQGTGAVGGIINMQTRNAALSDEEWTSTFRTRLTAPDSFNDEGFGYKGVYITGRKFNDLELTVGTTYESRGLNYDGNGDPVGIDTSQGDLADSTSRDFYIKTAYNISPDQRLQLMINDFRLRGNGDYEAITGDRDAGVPASTRPGHPEGAPNQNDVTTVSLDYNDKSLLDGELRLQTFFQDFAGLYGGGTFGTFQDPAIAPAGTLFDQSQNESRKFGVKMSYSHDAVVIPGLTITGGVDYLQDETSQNLVMTGREWVPESTFTNTAPFVQLNQKMFDGVLQLSGGVRYEMSELEVGDYTSLASSSGTLNNGGAGAVEVGGGNPSFEKALPNIGAVVSPTDALSFYASYSKGLTVADIGRVLRGVSTAGQDVDSLLSLEPVVSDNREIGIDYDDGEIKLHAAYFWSDSDLGSRLENVGGFFQVQRQRTEIQGFEASAEYALSDEVSVGTLYSLIEGEYDSNGDGGVDTDLDGANISPNRLNLYTDLRLYDAFALPVSGRIQLSHFFDRSFKGADAPTDQDFSGYTLVDLSASTSTGYGDFRLGVENLFDKQYVTYYGQAGTNRDDRYFAGRGRTFVLTYETQF